jgi:hypothetical protein
VLRTTILVVGMVLLATIGVASGGERSWNFDADKQGEIAEGLASEAGEWKVVADPTAPSKPNVLAQLAKNSGSTFNLTLITGTNYKDADISVKMKAVAGDEDQGGGLVWRAQDAKNYYVARYNPLEDNYRVYKVEKGRRITLQSAEIKHGGGWHALRVTMKENHIRCYFDGKEYLNVDDATLRDAGAIGLWTKADARSHFDDLTVDPVR